MEVSYKIVNLPKMLITDKIINPVSVLFTSAALPPPHIPKQFMVRGLFSHGKVKALVNKIGTCFYFTKGKLRTKNRIPYFKIL